MPWEKTAFPVGWPTTMDACGGLTVTSTGQPPDSADPALTQYSVIMAGDGAVNVTVCGSPVVLIFPGTRPEPLGATELSGRCSRGTVFTQAFLPRLRASGNGHIVNISSVIGLVSIPMRSAYHASKFGVRGFTDALRMELEIKPCGVSSTTIHPGGIKPNIVRNARTDESAMLGGATHAEMADGFDRLARTTPPAAANKIHKAVERNRRRALIGPDAVLFDIVSRLPTGLYQRYLVAKTRREREKRLTD